MLLQMDAIRSLAHHIWMNATEVVRVLLVEDSPSDMRIIREWLADEHSMLEYSVVDVHSLEDAIELLSQQDFEILLLDLGLTDSSGISTLQSIATKQRQVPVVVLTGLADEQLAFDAMRAGAQDFLVKSEFDQRTLTRCIRYAIERHRLEADRSDLSRQLLTVLEDEQQRIARELHDEVGGGLSGINLMANTLVRRLREQNPEAAKKARRIHESIQEVLDSFRVVLSGLSPVDVDEKGLIVALERLCDTIDSQSDDVSCHFRSSTVVDIRDSNIASNLFRIAQESLTNARKHSQATTLLVEIEQEAGNVVLRIKDDGVGFDLADCSNRGRGIRIMRHRVNLIRGVLSIEAGEDGTTIECKVENRKA